MSSRRLSRLQRNTWWISSGARKLVLLSDSVLHLCLHLCNGTHAASHVSRRRTWRSDAVQIAHRGLLRWSLDLLRCHVHTRGVRGRTWILTMRRATLRIPIIELTQLII